MKNQSAACKSSCWFKGFFATAPDYISWVSTRCASSGFLLQKALSTSGNKAASRTLPGLTVLIMEFYHLFRKGCGQVLLHEVKDSLRPTDFFLLGVMARNKGLGKLLQSSVLSFPKYKQCQQGKNM